MNEKIKGLAEKANFSNIIDDAYLERGDWEPFAEKFAELIIHECCREMGKYNVVTFAIDGVKERFGIE